MCKSILHNDASQLYPYLVCQPMPTVFYKHWDTNPESGKFLLRQKKTRTTEKRIMSNSQRTRSDYENESFYTTRRQKKGDCFSVD